MNILIFRGTLKYKISNTNPYTSLLKSLQDIGYSKKEIKKITNQEVEKTRIKTRINKILKESNYLKK